MFRSIEAVFNNRYNVIKEIGRGGMSVVYLAVSNDQLQQYRAIKIVKYEMIAGDSVLHEARILKDLEHDGIPRVIEIYNDAEAKQLYLIQEYVAGMNLKRVRAISGKISEVVLLKWFKELATILSYIHDRGVIHGDIKPENIMLTKEGKLKLIDFGISFNDKNKAKRAYSNYYASPEQHSGEKIDVRSEVYSLAIALYTIYIGAGLKLDVKENRPPTRAELDSAFSIAGLSHIFTKCIAEKPEARYQDMHALIYDINRLDNDTNASEQRYFSKTLQMWLAILLIILGLFFTVGGFTRMSVDRKIAFKDELQEIQDFIQIGKTNEAQVILNTLDEAEQEVELVKSLNVKLLYETADYQKCIDYIKTLKTGKLLSEKSDLLYFLAKSFYYLADYKQAAEQLEQIYLIDKSNELINCNYLISLLQIGEEDMATQLVATQQDNKFKAKIKTLFEAELAIFDEQYDRAIEKYHQLIEKTSDDELAFDLYLRLAIAYSKNIDKNFNSYLLLIDDLERAKSRFVSGRKQWLIQELLADTYQIEADYSIDQAIKEDMSVKAIDLYSALINDQSVRVRIFNKLANLYRTREEYDKLSYLLEQVQDDFSGLIAFRIQSVLLILDQQSLIRNGDRDYTEFIKAYRLLSDDFENLEDNAEYQQLKNRLKVLIKAGFVDDEIMYER